MTWIKREGRNGSGEEEKSHPFSRWVSWLFFLASLFLLLYIYYRAEIVYQGTMGAHYFKYYLISLVGIFFWGIVLRLRDGIRANIVTVVSSLVVGLYMIEGGLTFMGSSQQRSNAAAELGVEYDERSKLEVIEDLIAEGVDAVPTVSPAVLTSVIGINEEDIEDLFPLAGVSNKTTVYSNESGKYLIYKSDRHGFNNPDDQWDATNIDWFLTGDSFTHGAAVQPGQEIAGQIRSITRSPSISVGISANGPLDEYAALVEYGEALRPEKVLWVYFEGNDLKIDLQRNQKNPLLMQYMEDDFTQNLINRQQEIDNRLEEYILSEKAKAKAKAQAQAQLYKTRWIRLHAIRKVVGFDVDVDVDVDNPLFEKILAKAKDRVEAWGGELYFIYLPEYARYNKADIPHDWYNKKSEVINLVKELDIPVIDIHQEVFANHPDPLALFPFRLNGHYNADGYAEIAKAIVDGVKGYEAKNKK